MDDAARYRIQMAQDSLERVRRLVVRRDAALAMAEDMDGINGIDYSRPHVDASPTADGAVNLMEMRERRVAAALEAVSMCEGEVADAQRRLRMLEDGMHALLLTMRYIRGMRWRDIAARLGFSTQHVYEVRVDALLAYYEVMPSCDKAPKNQS